MLLEIKNLGIWGYAEHPRFSRVFQYSELLNCKFYTGLNFILCNLQDYGWGIAQAMCNGEILSPYSKTDIEIIFREEHLTIKELNDYSYYIKAEIDKGKIPYCKPNINKRLEIACKNSKYSVTEIKKIFALSEDLCSSSLSCMSSLLEEYSIAIGFALNKKIFCYHWLRYRIFEQIYEYDWKWLSQIAEKYNLIFIIPIEPDVDLKNADFDYKIVEFEKSDKNEA